MFAEDLVKRLLSVWRGLPKASPLCVLLAGVGHEAWDCHSRLALIREATPRTQLT